MNAAAPKRALPDAELTALIVELIPKPGEPRVVSFVQGQLDIFMTPASAEVWERMIARVEVLAAEHGHDQLVEIWDASLVAAHTDQGTLH